MFKPAKKLIIVLMVLFGLGVAVSFALAGGVDVGMEYGSAIGLGEADPRIVAANVIRIVLSFLGIIAVAIIIYGGFVWMTAGGDESKVENARKILISAVIGLLIILSAFAIATFVINRLLLATGTSGGDGAPCDSNLEEPGCQPSDSLCSSGHECIDCVCRRIGVLPPPDPIIRCDSNPLTPECDPDNDICGLGYSCNEECICKKGGNEGESCGTISPECSPEPDDCLPGLYCSDDCKCQKKSELYEACNATSTPGVCEANQNICITDLTCDQGDCLCKDFPIIKSINPVGGFCSGDINKYCSSDSDCADGDTCDSKTPNTAVGNIITINGVFFGDTEGQVMFWDGSDFNISGTSPFSVNPRCNSNWSNDQIVVVVPIGAVVGPIKVIRSDNESDETDNEQGPLIPDLVINNIVKPGLCKIDPDEGRIGLNINYYGINFSPSGGDIKFGSYGGNISGRNSNFSNTTSGSTETPNIVNGRTTTFVTAQSGMMSNYLKFTKLREIASGPFIASFEPSEGSAGAYITINGSGFGRARGASKVYFGDETSGFEASYKFPEICADSVWSDKQVIIKVPEGVDNGNYIITLALVSGSINTAGLSPNSFAINSEAPLLPSLCKIRPTVAQAGGEINLWGEYFDNFNQQSSKVRFYLEKDRAGVNISFWDLDPQSKEILSVYKIETTVHPGAITGPVKVVKDAPEKIGNSLDLQVGSCLDAVLPDEACGEQICCPEGTYKAGRCADNESECAVDIPSSVYEWVFSTSPSTSTIGEIFSSCAEKSKTLGTCEPEICPNSAGACSFYSGGKSETMGECDYSCQTAGDECASGGCSYNSTLNKCYDNAQANCSLPIEEKDVYGKPTIAGCALFRGKPHRVIFTNLSCPTGWLKTFTFDNFTNEACVNINSSCDLCDSGFDCVDDKNKDDIGLCVLPKNICPVGSVCESDDKCVKEASLNCECCCRIDKANEDCCDTLICGGDCGTDRNIDTDTYGYCSGCRIDLNKDGKIDENEQILSDQACNCSIASGKYCDVNAGPLDQNNVPTGVCRDCGQLAGKESCSAHHSTCCVDAMSDDKCRGEKGIKGMVDAPDDSAYCAYYQCTPDNTACYDLGNNPVAIPYATSSKYFHTFEQCNQGCSSPPIFGISCAGKATSTCDTSVCSKPFDCLNKSGLSSINDCGICCCDPSKTLDPCREYNINLNCQKDKEPCEGNNRGLCCGCVANTDCQSPEAIVLGCGSDSCCRARPTVTSTVPIAGAKEVCANAEIRVEFDQMMDVNSFSGNIIVALEHNGLCPEGTVYIAKAGAGFEDKNAITRFFYKARNFLRKPLAKILGKTALASDPPRSTMNYCAVVGSTTGEHQGKKTILRFSPSKLFNPGSKYFVIVKGDIALDNRTGVRSFWGIGKNTLISPVVNTGSFNGIVYPNSYIWSFETLSDQDGSLGICAIDRATIFPPSYLFQRVTNDLNENDSDAKHKTFDTVADKDKKFSAYALSSDNQILSPVSGYAWEWDWSVDDPGAIRIVENVFSTNDSSQLVETVEGVVDKTTKLNAEIRLTEKAYSEEGDGEKASADIYIFICENPWPPVRQDGSWFPWLDTPANCLPETGTCLLTNYALYYCRDAGAFGTADDLPAILSDAVTRGISGDLLKESYFFREKTPDITGAGLEARSYPAGQAAEFYWKEITDPAGEETVRGYKLYWAEKSGAPYEKDVSIPVSDAPYVPKNSWFRLTGLENEQTYYFALTAVYQNGQESKYSNEVSVLIMDTLPPAIPQNISVSTSTENGPEQIRVSWDLNSDDTETYKIYYGGQVNYYADFVEVSNDSDYGHFDIGEQRKTYFMAVSAIDAYGNKSEKSQQVIIVIP